MANIKFYRKGNYIIIEDSVSGKYIESPSSKVEVTKGILADTDYQIYIGGSKLYTDQAIAEIQDEGGSVYSQADFERFYQHNTGGPVSNVSEDSSKTTLAFSNTSAQLVAENLNRKGVLIFNNTDVALTYELGDVTVVANDGPKIAAGQGAFVETTEEVKFICDTATSGKVIAIEYL